MFAVLVVRCRPCRRVVNYRHFTSY